MTKTKSYSHLTTRRTPRDSELPEPRRVVQAYRKSIGKSPHTVSQEVKRHITVNPTGVKHFD